MHQQLNSNEERYQQLQDEQTTHQSLNLNQKMLRDFVQQFLNGDDMPHINILEGMTCERDKDWLRQQIEL